MYLTCFSLFVSCRSDDGVKAYNSQPNVTITSHSAGVEIFQGFLSAIAGYVSDAYHSSEALRVTWSTFFKK